VTAAKNFFRAPIRRASDANNRFRRTGMRRRGFCGAPLARTARELHKNEEAFRPVPKTAAAAAGRNAGDPLDMNPDAYGRNGRFIAGYGFRAPTSPFTS
jgi:hypothetical protein